MSVVELRQSIGRYTTFSEQDILKDLGSAIPEAKDGDMGIPQPDSITSPTMTDVRDTWLSPCRWHHIILSQTQCQIPEGPAKWPDH